MRLSKPMHIGQSRRAPDIFWEKVLIPHYHDQFFVDVVNQDHAYHIVNHYVEEDVYTTVCKVIQSLDTAHYREEWDPKKKEFITVFDKNGEFI